MCWKALLQHWCQLCLRLLSGSTVSKHKPGEKPGNYGLKDNYNRAHNNSLISPSSLLVNNQIPSFQGTPPSPSPTEMGEAGSGQGNWVLPGEFGVRWTQLLDLISHGSRDVPRISPLRDRTGWLRKREFNHRKFMKTGNATGGQIQARILLRAHGMGSNAGLGARRSCLCASLNLPGDWEEVPWLLKFSFFNWTEEIGLTDL